MPEQTLTPEIETFVEQSAPINQPTVQDDLPYRVSLTDCGCAVVLESPYGGHKPEWPERRTEILVSRFDWNAIVTAVEANFAEAERRAIEHNALDRMLGDDD